MPNAQDAFENLEFRVLEENDPEYGILVARCLETGTTATANDLATLRTLLKQALSLHIKLAMEREDPEALYHQRATADVWARYAAASAMNKEQDFIEVDVSCAPRREVKSEISIAQNLKRETA